MGKTLRYVKEFEFSHGGSTKKHYFDGGDARTKLPPKMQTARTQIGQQPQQASVQQGLAKGGKLTAKQQTKVGKVMGEYKSGTLRSGSKKGPKVGSREQAIAIALSEARKK